MKSVLSFLLFTFGSCAFACSATGGASGDGDGDGDVSGDGDTSPGSGAAAGDGDAGTGSASAGDGDGDAGTGGTPGDGDATTGGQPGGDGDGDLGTGGTPGGCTPNPSGTSVDQGDGTFVDERSCLMWMKSPWPNDGTQTGRAHVASCPSATTGGYSDWRGPDAAEMVSLLRLDGVTCGMWHDPPLWDPIIDVSGLNAPIMFYTATEGDGLGSEHQCAINGNFGDLNGGSRLNTGWGALCVRGTSPVTGTITECVGTGCDYAP